MDRDFIFQQDGAPPHFHREVKSYLDHTVVAGIGRGGTKASSLSPDLTHLDFSVWGTIKTKCVPSLPASLDELQAQITEAVATIDANKIHRIWDKIAYRWDICHVTQGNHINTCEYLSIKLKHILLFVIHIVLLKFFYLLCYYTLVLCN